MLQLATAIAAFVRSRVDRIRREDFDCFVQNEVCFLATSSTPEVQCRNLPVHERLMGIMTWYPNNPWRHFVEWLFSVALAIFFVSHVWAADAKFSCNEHKNMKRAQRKQMPLPVLCVLLYHIYYNKFFVTVPEATFLFNLCHQTWMVRFLLHIFPTTPFWSDCAHHFCIAAWAGTLFYIMTDGSLALEEGEEGIVSWPFFHHFVLLWLPALDLIMGRVTFLPRQLDDNMSIAFKQVYKQHMIACGFCTISQLVIGIPACILLGYNVTGNFIIVPNRHSAHLFLGSKNRFIWRIIWAFISFLLARIFWVAVDVIFRLLNLTPYSPHRRQGHTSSKLE